ncbi:MAG: ABC transporter ATP-binding protein [Lachnospira sp.]|nr:ABC transporter ATP-binding protein [Lachnospira sp.]
MSEILTINGLRKTFEGKPALDDVNVHLQSGKIYGLLGPNGSGKTTLIKLINGLLVPDRGEIYVEGHKPGPESKSVVSYLPDKLYFNTWMKVSDLLHYYADFYTDFDIQRAKDMLKRLQIDEHKKMKNLSKGTKEKVQLILVMSRRAKLYVLDEPIGGVDPAARDYILETIITNYDPEASVLMSTHLISDIENVLDEVIFIRDGQIVMAAVVDDIREREGKSVDELFREVFRC